MNKRLGAIFTVITDNEVVCFDTNLKDVHNAFKTMEPSAGNYQWFYRKFLKENRFSVDIDDKKYWFQKLV